MTHHWWLTAERRYSGPILDVGATQVDGTDTSLTPHNDPYRPPFLGCQTYPIRLQASLPLVGWTLEAKMPILH
jgi:hypothetical protein